MTILLELALCLAGGAGSRALSAAPAQGPALTTPHTWRIALPHQRCQERRCFHEAAYALVIAGSMSGEELLCASCAFYVARQFGLSDPTTSIAGADALAQTSEALAVTSSEGLGTNHRSNL